MSLRNILRRPLAALLVLGWAASAVAQPHSRAISINDNRRVCFLLHGHGTGALKDAIRKELKQSPYVRYFRAGHHGEGGDGVTVAWLS